MSKTSLLKKLVPSGTWVPDAPEFVPATLDQLANSVPVFGVYRTVQRLIALSQCPDAARRVTGTFIHRLSIDSSIDILQPDYSEASPPWDPKAGFQAVPPDTEFWQALNGESASAASTILLIPRGTTGGELYGLFELPHKDWDAVTALTVKFQYRIQSGFTGGYQFIIFFGVADQGSPEVPSLAAVPLGSKSISGTLEVDGDGAQVVDSFTIANALLPANPHLQRYYWRIRHFIDTGSGAGEEGFNPVQVASVDELQHIVSFYEDENGSNAPGDVADSIDGYVGGVFNPDQLTFARSRKIYSTEASGKGFWIKCDLPQFVNLFDHKIKFEFAVESIAQTVSIGLYASRTAGVAPIQSWLNIGAAAPNTPTEFIIQGPSLTEGVNPSLIAQIQDWSQVWLFFFTHIPVTTSTQIHTIRPDVLRGANASPNVVGFGALDIQSALSDVSDLSGVTMPPGSFVQLPLEVFNELSAGIQSLTVTIRGSGAAAAATVIVTFLQSVNLASYSSQQEGVSLTFPGGGFIIDNAWNPSHQMLSVITDWARIHGGVQLIVSVDPSSTGSLNLVEVSVTIVSGVGSRSTLYGISYVGPSPTGPDNAAAPIDVSWIRADGPAKTDAAQQDELRAYIGTVAEPQEATQEGKIYEIASPDFVAWEDVTRTVPYTSNVRDKSWSFTNFGELVIATNFADAVQVKNPTDALFRNLIGNDMSAVAIPDYATDGGVVPRARFAASINAFLCLANCDPSSVSGVAAPYSFWCSRYAQPNYFAIGSIEWQSSVFQLAASPGEITGMIGGEWGLLFKENSVWRADYVGLPQIFDFVQVSGQQGTVQPRSIVRVEDDVYFWGIGGIYVVRGGETMEEVAGQGSVRKFLFDSQFEEFGLSVTQAGLESESSVRVVGGYDAYSGCVFWSYLTQRRAGLSDDGDWFKCDAIIVYSPREGRFGFVAGNGSIVFEGVEPVDDTRIVGVTDLFTENDTEINGWLTLGNRATSGKTHLLRTILAVSGIPPIIASFSGSPTYTQFFRSGTVPAAFFGAPPGVEIEIQRVRAVLAVERSLPAPAHITWIESNQSPAVGDGTGKVVALESTSEAVHEDGWIDLGTPLSGEWFKFAIAFDESIDPILKEFHGWQVIYRIAGDH